MKSKINSRLIVVAFMAVVMVTTPCFADNSQGITVDLTSKYLVAPQAKSYQWYFNDVAVEKGNDRFFTPTASGHYAVELKDDEGNVKSEEAFIVVTAATVHKVYLIGDSTVANYTAGSYPQTGWGQVLQKFFNSASVVVDNRAVGGTSSKSFYNNQWPAVKSALKSGDYLFIQFGINDSKKTDTTRYTVPFTTFTQYLTKFVKEARAKGAIPVLVSTLVRNSWTTTGTVYPAYHDYPVATRQLAQSSLNVPLIDLDQMSTALLQSVGQTYSTNFMYMNLAAGEYPNFPAAHADDVHFQEMGAIEMAKLVAQGVGALSLNSSMSFLSQNLLPTFQVSTSSNNSAAGIITRSTAFPAGLNITIKGFPASGHKLVQWNDGANNVVATTPKFSFTMGSAARSYKGYFDQVNISPAITIQENTTGFCSLDGTIDNNNTGFTGAGFANANNAVGAGINWSANSASGSATISWRYANGGGADRPGKLLVNGSTVISNISFPATTNWTTWSTVSANVNLSAGVKTIRLEATSATGLANIDHVTISATSVQAVSCASGARISVSALESKDLKGGETIAEGLQVSPNPSNNSFVIKVSGAFNYTIYDQLGREMENGAGHNETSVGGLLRPSVYILKVNTESKRHQFRLIKE